MHPSSFSLSRKKAHEKLVDQIEEEDVGEVVQF
jgi:hypothetical protein